MLGSVDCPIGVLDALAIRLFSKNVVLTLTAWWDRVRPHWPLILKLVYIILRAIDPFNSNARCKVTWTSSTRSCEYNRDLIGRVIRRFYALTFSFSTQADQRTVDNGPHAINLSVCTEALHQFGWLFLTGIVRYQYVGLLIYGKKTTLRLRLYQ